MSLFSVVGCDYCSPCSYQHVRERIAIEDESLDCKDERMEESLEMSS